jgi:hypothetical protein
MLIKAVMRAIVRDHVRPWVTTPAGGIEYLFGGTADLKQMCEMLEGVYGGLNSYDFPSPNGVGARNLRIDESTFVWRDEDDHRR